MILSSRPPLHLTYCQNIHPGETWAEHLEAVRVNAVAVKAALDQKNWFGLGLRLSAKAAEALQSSEALAQGLHLFHEQQLYPFSVNAFPFGQFHKGPVKDRVYAPDWRSQERVQYTLNTARALAAWLPDQVDGSISTVPGSFAPWIASREDELAMAGNLGSVAAELARLEEETGRQIHLGLEPEPDCFLETTAQTVAFFRDALPSGAVPEICKQLGVNSSRAMELMHRHIGVCFDTCHVALQYENLAFSLRELQKADIRISKIQLSAALKAPACAESYDALAAFREPTYLHQVKGRATDGSRVAWYDLPEALAEFHEFPQLEEVRVHFHVPLFVSPGAPLASTADALDEEFWGVVRSGICPHLEIETYTFDVLPEGVHPGDLIRSIESEYRWVMERLRQ